MAMVRSKIACRSPPRRTCTSRICDLPYAESASIPHPSDTRGGPSRRAVNPTSLGEADGVRAVLASWARHSPEHRAGIWKETCVTGDHSTAPFFALADLASARVGGRAVVTNDDFFASKSNLVKPEPPIFIPGKF